MRASEHTPKEKTEAKPLTPAEEIEQAKRKVVQDQVRKYHLRKFRGRNVFGLRRSDGSPVEEEETPGVGNVPYATLEAGSGSLPGLKKMEEGWYEIFEVAERGKEVKYDKFKVVVYVDKNGGISPGEPFDIGNPYKSSRVWTQIVRAYVGGLGINQLNYDFPNCYTKRGAPDYSKYMLIDLKGVLRTIEIAEKEGAAIHIPPGSALEARLANAKNKAEEKLLEKIKDALARSQSNVANNQELKEQQAKAVHAFHAAGLNTDSNALKAKTSELKDALEADVPTKISELETARSKLDARLSQIEQELGTKYKPSPDLYSQYDRAFSETSKLIGEATRVVNEKAVPEKEKANVDKLKKDLNDLKIKADQLGKKAGVNAIDSSEKRAEEKLKDLQTKLGSLQGRAAGFAKVPAANKDEMKKAADDLQGAMREMTKSLSEISTESKKENSLGAIKKYQDAIADVKAKSEKLKTDLGAHLKDFPDLKVAQSALETQLVAATRSMQSNEALKTIETQILKDELAELKEPTVTPEQKHLQIEDNIERVDSELRKWDRRMKTLNDDLENLKNLPPEKVNAAFEKLMSTKEDLAVDVSILAGRKEGYKGFNEEMIKDQKNPFIDKNKEYVETFKQMEGQFQKLNDTIDKFNKSAQEFKDNLPQAQPPAPAPGIR